MLLTVSQFLSAQSNGTFQYYDGEEIFKNIILPLIILITIFTSIFYLIAFYEGKNKKEDYYISKSINTEIWGWLVIAVLTVTGLLYLLDINNINPYIAVIPLKIIIAFIVSYIAKKKNRNPLLWWFLGFIEYHSALIVLATTKSILPLKKGNSNDDLIYNEKLNKLNILFNDKIINSEEFKTKINDLEKEHSKKYKASLTKNENKKKIDKKNDLIKKLNDAYNQGVLTENEYQNKITQLKKTSNDDSIDEEKERFVSYYNRGMITEVELKEKLKRIDDYRNEKNQE